MKEEERHTSGHGDDGGGGLGSVVGCGGREAGVEEADEGGVASLDGQDRAAGG